MMQILEQTRVLTGFAQSNSMPVRSPPFGTMLVGFHVAKARVMAPHSWFSIRKMLEMVHGPGSPSQAQGSVKMSRAQEKGAAVRISASHSAHCPLFWAPNCPLLMAWQDQRAKWPSSWSCPLLPLCLRDEGVAMSLQR